MAKKLNPKDFRMPAEWEPHEGTWLQWPHDDQWIDHQLKLEKIWLEMTAVLHEHENVHIIVPDVRRLEHLEHQLHFFGIGLRGIDFHIIPTNDVWARDNSPIFVVDKEGRLAVTNWKFNGWGERYKYDRDNQVPVRISAELSLPIFSPPLVLEGGGVEVNGKGTFLATRSSIVNENRNPGKSQKEIEAIISQHLGVKHFIWLTGTKTNDLSIGWADDTDTHIDTVARFTDESAILYAWTNDEADPRYGMLKKLEKELKEATTESGKCVTLVPLPLPQKGVYSTSRIGPGPMRESPTPIYTDASYTNYLVANGTVLVPIFGNVNDDRALKVIGEQFPDRETIGINCVALIENGGAIHCVTQQQPAPQLPR
jgi:agmatine deiminase